MKRPLAALGAVGGAALVVAGLQVAGVGAASANPAGTGLVISEVYSAGQVPDSPYDADFIELYNPSSAPIPLAGTSLQIRSSFNTVRATIPLSGTAPAGRAFLVQISDAGTASASHLDLPTPDLTAVAAGQSWIDLGASDEVILGTGSTYPAPEVAGAAGVIDAVSEGGYAGDGSYETSPAPSGDQNYGSLQRAAGGVDTDNNAVDFSWAGPNPCNTSCTSAQLSRTESEVSVPAFSKTSGTGPAPIATVTGSGGVPTGRVTVTTEDPRYSASTWSGPLDSAGSATVNLPDLLPGSYTFTVHYAGDASYRPSSSTFSVTVTAGNAATTVAAPNTTLPALDSGTTVRADVPLTVTAGDGGTPTGTVSVWDGTDRLAAVSLLAGQTSASVSIYTANMLPGATTLTVWYQGDATYAPSSSTFTVTAPRAYSDTSVSAPAVTAGSAGHVAVTVASDWPGIVGDTSGVTVSGTVTLAGAGAAQTKTVGADGGVSFDLPTTLAPGSYALTATYAGNDRLASSSAKVTFTVRPRTGSTGGTTVQPPAGTNHGTHATAAQQKLSKDQAKLAKLKKAYKKAHGAKKAKLKKSIAKLKKTIKKDKKNVGAGK
ncbi:Ig-like domain repeat protein [Nocardioides sp. BP30]|uniref:Ig-like domain repeat protein n=1 Tax=Nocardioides sp. BP30 TaxID=3036374 RepID=UPI0024697163|nr:Ig-like domain repeat protein [Nocardioides sp. BP30]WGL53038.1 Ig-like domain repeat protein [Nocardioides sp. BP30]